MPSDEDNKSTPESSQITTGKPSESIQISGPLEVVQMNKYHFQLVITRLLAKPKGPRLEHVMIPIGIFFATLLTLLPADFQDYLGIAAAVWHAVALIVCGFSLIASVGLGWWWLRYTRKHPEKTDEEIYEDICKDIQKDKEKLDAIHRQQEIDEGDSQTE